MSEEKLEKLARELERHDDYRVIRRYRRVSCYNDPDPALIENGDMRLGVYLDVETTGLDAATDQVIELGLVPFEFASDGRIFRVLEDYNGLRDPGIPIPPEITGLTGITDKMVAGHVLDDARIAAIVEPAHLIVAHNAAFDRPFAEQLHALFASKAWACSMSEVPWREEGIEGTKLDYLAYQYGFFYDAHRATGDCLAGIDLLARKLPQSGTAALGALLANARARTMRIWAKGSPYESKDRLKGRAYRWNSGEDGRPKSWYKDVPETDVKGELDFLRQDVYGGHLPDLPMDTINAFNRFSSRA